MTVAARAPLIEVFHSIQGEGRFVGAPMGFVRVAACPIRCRYCDTPHSYVAPADFPVQLGETSRREPNPVEAARAAALALEVERASPTPRAALRAVSVTGGEPLLHPRFVRELGESLAAAGVRLHLETAALDPEALQECLPVVAHLSADWKLPETLQQPRDFSREHLGCIAAAAAAGRTIDVKIVLTASVREPAFAGALASLLPHRTAVLLVLQPVTPFGGELEPVPPALVRRSAARAAELGFDFRVLPQVHKALGVP